MEELLRVLQEDLTIPARFPVRFILMDDIRSWQELFYKIRGLVDRIVCLSDLCSGADTLPDIDRLTFELHKDRDRNILVLPLAEYLRLHEDQRDCLRTLASIDESSTKRRVYIPLCNISDVFFSEMNKLSRFADRHLCEHYVLKSDDRENQDGVRIIFVPDRVDVSMLENELCRGLKAYFRLWENGGRDKIVLATQFAKSFKSVHGSFSLLVLRNSFEVVAEYIQGSTLLREEDGTEEQWDTMLRTLRRGETIHDVFRRVFNSLELDTNVLFRKWRDYTQFQRWLLWMWCRFDLRAGYLQHVFSHNKSCASLVDDMVNGVFRMPAMASALDLSWLRERKEALECLGVANMPSSFWKGLRAITDPLQILRALTGISDEEKREAIIAVGKLLEQDVPPEKWMGYLEIVYPELAWYLEALLVDDELLYRYFREYCRAKLMDKVTDDIVQLAQEAHGEHHLWKIPVRKNVLDQEKPKSGKVYWVDGLGVEWLGLVVRLIKRRYPDVSVDYIVTRANLPTITDYNRGWDEDGEHYSNKGLDVLIHNYTCEYPDYIIKEIETVDKIIQEAIGFLGDAGRLIVASDHGTSRLAAIYKGESVPLPAGAVAEKFGRYCVCTDAYEKAGNYDECVAYDNNLIFATHRRFRMSGNVQGETHGGATLEEVLVPVLLLGKATPEERQEQIPFKLLTPQVKLDARKEGVLKVAVECQMEKLTMVASGNIFEGRPVGDHWEFRIIGLKSAKHTGKLYGRISAKNHFIGEVEFGLQLRGLVQTEMEI